MSITLIYTQLYTLITAIASVGSTAFSDICGLETDLLLTLPALPSYRLSLFVYPTVFIFDTYSIFFIFCFLCSFFISY